MRHVFVGRRQWRRVEDIGPLQLNGSFDCLEIMKIMSILNSIQLKKNHLTFRYLACQFSREADTVHHRYMFGCC